MTTIPDYKQANSDIALIQSGSAGVSRAEFVLGAKSGQPELFNWDTLRFSWASNNPDYVTWFDDFFGDTLNGTWQPTLSTGATIAVNSQVGGAIRFTTDTDDDDFAYLTLGLHWQVSNGPIVFGARVKTVTNALVRAIEVGLSDALTETNGLAFSDHSVAGVTAVATDAVIFGYDTDASMTNWAVNNVNADTEAAVDSGVAPSTSYQELIIVVMPDGTAFFYINGELISRVADAIATTAVLTPWISLKSLSGAAKSIDVDFVGVACPRA